MRPILPVLLLVGLAACISAPPSRTASVRPALPTGADSLAWGIVEASGGLAAWDALPVLRFDFGVERDEQTTIHARHLWDRTSGRYRIEWASGTDSTTVALFDVDGFDARIPTGDVYLNGVSLSGPARTAALAEAYERHINDTYWLLAPLKLFDPGVRRALEPERDDADTRTLALHFDGVGLTPGDRYWLRADRATGRLVTWQFHLQDEAEPGARYEWGDTVEVPTAAGPIRLAARKTREGTTRAVVTPVHPRFVAAPDLFTDGRPRLASGAR